MARFLIFTAALALAFSSIAALNCNGVISAPNPITSDVTVNGGSCVLNGISVTGSVRVSGGGSLATVGQVRIFGTLSATDSGSLDLAGNLTVSGGLSASNVNGFVKVGPIANIGSAMLTNVPSFVLSGTTALLSSSGPGAVVISGGRITGGGLRRFMTEGPTTLCGASIAGGISLGNVNGDLKAVTTSTCAPSSISGTISVSKGTGDVLISGGMLIGADVLVGEQVGNFLITNARLSDLNINLVTGSVTLESAIADSDGLISGVTGLVTLRNSMFNGDLSISGNHMVSLINNKFGFEVVNVVGNKGSVTIRQNRDFSIVATENAGLTFAGNKVSVGSINKNTVSTSITDNSFTTVSCSDNVPNVVASGNTATFATGQCASFRPAA